MNIKKTLLRNKNLKLGYYLDAFQRELFSNEWYKQRKDVILNFQKEYDQNYILDRLNYYNKLNGFDLLNKEELALTLKEFEVPNFSKVYYFDLKKYLQYFDYYLKFLYVPGDNIETFTQPTIVKSRPIHSDSCNEILMKINAVRHFNFIQDDIQFEDKKDLLFGRLAVYQPHRIAFFEQHFNNPLCDIGDVAVGTDSKWLKDKVSINEHLNYKFILALEGNDVATNLKWIMSSNSIAVMPKPKYETWFMEGRLIPNVHYICVKDDYSDLDAQLEYYINNPAAAQEIIKNAQKWVAPFKDKNLELLLNILVLDKYFKYTNI